MAARRQVPFKLRASSEEDGGKGWYGTLFRELRTTFFITHKHRYSSF